MNKKPALLEWVNLIGTYVGPVIIGVLLYTYNSSQKIQRMEIEKRADESYVSKSSFDYFQQETNHRLDSIASDVSQTKQDVATIKGRMQYQNNHEKQQN